MTPQNLAHAKFVFGDTVKITSDRIMAGRTKVSFLKTNGLHIGMVGRVRGILSQHGYVDILLQTDSNHGAIVRDTMLTKL